MYIHTSMNRRPETTGRTAAVSSLNDKYWRAAVLIAAAMTLFLGLAACGTQAERPPQTFHPEMEYLKVINAQGKQHDPESLFLQMGMYLNTNQAKAGISFFANLIASGAEMPDGTRALYFTLLGLLRGAYAEEVPLLQRIGWVKETIQILEDAKKLGGPDYYHGRWASGLVYSRLPGWFGMRDTALADLTWCLEHDRLASDLGWLREVYFHLALVHRDRGEEDKAKKYLAESGYSNFNKSTTLMTPFSVDMKAGLRFSRRHIRETVAGTVYTMSGFDFTEYNFIVSRDRRQLISIDAGTRPDTTEAAYKALKALHPDLPPLTTVLVTHSHWDHIGGHRYFRKLNPSVKFYARSNYGEELSHSIHTQPRAVFFGAGFEMSDIADFKPEMTVASARSLEVGGTRFDLIPIEGGETADGMFIFMPQEHVLFAGDFIMPYMGAPFVEEGNIDGLFSSIDTVVRLKPQHLLHGHAPLTRLFNSPQMLADLKTQLVWLKNEVLLRIWKGESRPAIHHQNLIPPTLANHLNLHVPYMVIRENMINRIFDQNTGYWGPELEGMDTLGSDEIGRAMAQYFGWSESSLVSAGKAMLARGDHQLAAKVARWGEAAFPKSAEVKELRKQAFTKLVEQYQAFNPFKFIIYSGEIPLEIPALPPLP